ncbi:MAG TPA: hypothetical protein VF980_04670 [Thermoanaerobaculia bacterium]
MRWPIRVTGMVALALLAGPAFAAGPQVPFVPWKVLERGAEPAQKAFLLFWIPASPEQMRRSELITSTRLTAYSSRCIGMHVVRADDSPMLEKLQAGKALPLAVLVAEGKEIARVIGDTGVLSANSVEAMVRNAFDTREATLNAMLDQAGSKAASGDSAAAIALYKQVAAQQCAFPRQARTAQRSLRRLGVH